MLKPKILLNKVIADKTWIKFSLPVLFILLKFFFIHAFNLSWFSGDPLIVLVVSHTFFYSLDFRRFSLYAVFCGFLNDIIGLEVFGIYMFSYMVVALAVSAVCRVIYRHNRIFIFPLVFCAAILNNVIFLIMNWLMGRLTSVSSFGWFAGSSLLDAFAAVLLAFFLRVWLASIFEARTDKCV